MAGAGDQWPTQAVGAVSVQLGLLTLTAGGGAALTSHFGAPAWRLFVGLGVTTRRGHVTGDGRSGS